MRLKQLSVMLILSISINAIAAPPDTVPAPAKDVTVVNTPGVVVENNAGNPVPVTGDVNANVTGDVDVSGSVEVTSVPETLTDQIDLLIEKVDALNTETEPANFVKYWVPQQAIGAGEKWIVTLDTPVKATLLTVSAENDRGRMSFCVASGGCSEDNFATGNEIYLGSRGQTFPGVLTVPLTQPVVITGFKFACRNLVESCEIKVSVVGNTVE